MPTLDDVRERLRFTKQKQREAEDVLLAERARERELRAAYREQEVVRPSTLPRNHQSKEL